MDWLDSAERREGSACIKLLHYTGCVEPGLVLVAKSSLQFGGTVTILHSEQNNAEVQCIKERLCIGLSLNSKLGWQCGVISRWTKIPNESTT